MIAKILQRMNRRERILAGAVALVVFFLANLFVWSWLFRAAGDSRVEVVTRKQKHAEQTVLLRETDLWTNRDKWLREHQPAFHGASDASALLDQLKQVASKYSVLIENPAIGPSARDRQLPICFGIHRNEKSMAAAGSFSLRCPGA